jgi:hypothetical protein
MNDNTESIIFTKNFIKLLDEDGFFNETENPFMDSDLLYEEILKKSTENSIEFETPNISMDQFDDCVKNVRLKLIQDTFDELIDEGLVEISGLDSKGEFLYSVNQEVKDEIEKKSKKKRPKA